MKRALILSNARLAIIASIVMVLSAVPQAQAGEGHDHGDGGAAPSANGPQRLPDGSVFLPKPAQRQLGVRTMATVDAELPRSVELTGMVLMDPNAGGTHRMTSDAYFEENRRLPEASRARFDLIFIDGLHEHQQVLRDVDNALDCLLPGGTIVLHDCMPCAQAQQVVPRPKPHSFWTGDVWKAIFDLRTRPDLDVAVGRFDWGVAVLRVRPNSRPFAMPPGARDWPFYLAHCKGGLNPMGYDELMRWVGVDAADKAGRGADA